MASTPLRVTVVVPCRNDAEFLEPALTALEAQTRLADRIVVVDNASTDASAQIARTHGVDLVHEPLVGIWPAAARGYDEAATDADIIARIDADSRPHPDWLERVERAFQADPMLGVLSGAAEFYGANRLIRYIADNWYVGLGHRVTPLWLGRPLVFGSNFAMRAEIWRRVEPRVARTDARVHDDLDLTIRLRKTDGIVYDRDLRMPVSARPFASLSALSTRVWRVFPTFAVSWPEGSPVGSRRADAAAAAGRDGAGNLDDWSEDDGGLAPEFGR